MIERATILAEGALATAVLRWIVAQGGEPEYAAPPSTGRGLHSPRTASTGGTMSGKPLRYVLPPGVLS